MKKILLLSLIVNSFLFSKVTMAYKIADKTIHYSDGSIKKGGHRNWRNNNPGNLEYGKFSVEHGAIGTDGRFAIFSTMKDGYIAQVALLSGDKYKHKTLHRALIRYAPHHENNTHKYLNYLTKNLHISKNKKLSSFSFNLKLKLVKYMAMYEGMRKGRKFNSRTKFNKYLYSKNKKNIKRNVRVALVSEYSKKKQRMRTKKKFHKMLNPKKTRLRSILIES